MVDESRLSPAQLHDFHERLERRFRELRKIISDELLSSDEERYSDLAGKVHDLADESMADLLADVNLAVIDSHVNEIREVEAAILRISGGSFGLCGECGEAISLERLNAYPSAPRCLRCQSRREREYAQPGHSTL